MSIQGIIMTKTTGNKIAYIRVSTVEQNTERQLADVEGFDKVFEDKCSGSTTDRPSLAALLDYVREGDEVHVHSIDRLARNLNDLLSLVELFKSKGVTLVFNKESMTFSGSTSDPMQELMLSMIGAVAQFERAVIRERQAEGIAQAKAKGVYSKSRKKKVDRDQVKELLAGGLPLAEIARRLNCSTKTIQRIRNTLND